MILKTNQSERTITDFEPKFSPDFAARVMREAARIQRRRRVVRGALGVAALGGLILLMRPAQFIATQPKPNAQLASSPAVTEWSEANDSDYTTDSYNAQYDPDKASAANYMFPDASSLEDFNSQLSNEQSATDYSVPTDYYSSNQ
jgi:hypothetical protein